MNTGTKSQGKLKLCRNMLFLNYSCISYYKNQGFSRMVINKQARGPNNLDELTFDCSLTFPQRIYYGKSKTEINSELV